LFFWVFRGGFFISLSGLPPLAGSALKLLGVLTIVFQYPVLLAVLIFTSMVSLYYYLRMFINSLVCLGSGNYSIYRDLIVRSRLIVTITIIMSLN
jgi:NADH:ubiquinone oxidoreductase subunit 2 (subunit N)